MKKSKLILVFALSSCLLFNSCIGSFGLFNNVLSWNKTVGNKFVNELVFLALNIIPVYSIAFAVDAVVINSIEFWTGSNPMANVGEVRSIKGENGDYLVKTLENGYSINKEGEKEVNLTFNQQDQTWNVVSESENTKLIKMNNDGTAQLYLPSGDTMNVTLDAKGMSAARQLTMTDLFFAAR